MNLLRLLTERRSEILARCQKKITEVMGSRSTSVQLDRGLPALYEEIIEVLQSLASDTGTDAKQRTVAETITASATRKHAQEAYRLGYTVAQLVHGYGCVCQAITEYAFETGANIEASEFSQLNLSLDVAIAQAVSEFQVLSLQNAERGELLRMGFLVHELRNALTAVTMSHELIKMGGVGASGATSAILSSSLLHMKELLDRSIAEVRLRGKPTIARVQLSLLGLISQIEASALPEANAKGICLRVDGDPTIEVVADPHLVTSAVAKRRTERDQIHQVWRRNLDSRL